MKRWLPSVALLSWLVAGVAGNEIQLKEDDANRQRCQGMYDRKSWGGSVDPFILVKYLKAPPELEGDPLVSMVIFEWQDEYLIGRYRDPNNTMADKETICNIDNAAAGLCNQTGIGAFIVSPNVTELSKNPVISQAIHLKGPTQVNYPIHRTGFYCVSTYAYSDIDYTAVVEFRNAYGELPGAQIAKLPFYGGLTITYAVLGAFWGFLYWQNRSDILPVQNYITATIIFLIVEQLMTWGYYDYQNRHGNNALNKIFMVVVAILNAGRNSLSFFLLLIVCMGYGVVKPSLGRTMIYVRILAIAHFVFAVIYAMASFSITPDAAGPLVLFVVLPLAATLTAFYVWTLNSLNLTMKDLIDRKQKTKAMMYKKLWWCILGSIMVIFVFFFVNSFAFAGSREANFVPEHWKSRWFVLDGWLNIVYFFDISFIAYLWRPTPNNRRFAMSDELAQEDDTGFEIRSMVDSLEDDEERRGAPYDRPLPTSSVDAERAPISSAAGASKQTEPPPPRPRESLDGETIFALGEDGDKWSDEEDDDQAGHTEAGKKRPG